MRIHLSNLAFLRQMPSRRVLHLVLCLSVFVLGYVLIKGARFLSVFYSSGEFVNYHMDMTPGFSEAPVKSISTVDIGYSAVFLYFISSTHLRELLLSLYYLHTNLPSSMPPWPILLFYARSSPLDSSPSQTEILLRLYDFLGGGQEARWFLARIEFVPVDLHLPEGMSHNKVDVNPIYIHAWPGYHLQSGFFSTHIFSHPRLEGVDYYLRLSPDTFLYQKVCFDPFEVMHAQNRSYGFHTLSKDPGWLVQGIYPLISSFASSRPSVERTLQSNNWTWPEGMDRGTEDQGRKMLIVAISSYDTSFEVVKLERFRSAEVKEWLDEIMSDPERVYKYRWSDAAIRYTTVQMYLDVNKEVEQICGLPCFHDGVHPARCSCEKQKHRQKQKPAVETHK